MLINRIFYAVILIASFVLMIKYQGFLGIIIFAVVLLVPLISLLITASVKKKCDFEMEWPQTVEKNSPCAIKIKVKNSSEFPISKISLRAKLENLNVDSVYKTECQMHVNGKKSDKLIWPFKSKFCGKIKIKIEDIYIYDFFALFSFRCKKEFEGSVIVLPQLHSDDFNPIAALFTNLDSLQYSQTKKGTDNSEIFGIKEYSDGDSTRSIHWKLSSKHDEIYVKEYSLPTSNSIYLLLENISSVNGEPIKRSTQNKLTEAFISLSYSLLQKNIQHTVAWYNDRNGMLEEIELNRIDDLLAGMNVILSAKPHKDKPYSLEYRKNSSAAATTHHTVYFTPELFENELNSFNTLGRVTVMYCTEDMDAKKAEINRNFEILHVKFSDSAKEISVM